MGGRPSVEVGIRPIEVSSLAEPGLKNSHILARLLI